VQRKRTLGGAPGVFTQPRPETLAICSVIVLP